MRSMGCCTRQHIWAHTRPSPRAPTPTQAPAHLRPPKPTLTQPLPTQAHTGPSRTCPLGPHSRPCTSRTSVRTPARTRMRNGRIILTGAAHPHMCTRARAGTQRVPTPRTLLVRTDRSQSDELNLCPAKQSGTDPGVFFRIVLVRLALMPECNPYLSQRWHQELAALVRLACHLAKKKP